MSEVLLGRIFMSPFVILEGSHVDVRISSSSLSSLQLLHVAISEPCCLSEFTLTGPHEWSSLPLIYLHCMLEKGGKECLEDQRFRHWEEFKMASLVYEAWHAYYLFINNLQMFKGIPSNAFKGNFKGFKTIPNTSGSGKNLMPSKVRTVTIRKSFYFSTF